MLDPVVSVVLVNFRGSRDTIEAVRRLALVDYPSERLEIIVVENGSGDDSAEVLAHELPDVRLIISSENLGFAGGSNLGAREASGQIVAFLNNDAKPDARWVRAAVEAFEAPDVAGVASKVVDWDGRLVDYIGSGLTWFGMGYKPLTGEPLPSGHEQDHDVLFGTGAAMFVRGEVFRELGGFDERYFMFFEDVDFGWRLNLAGHRFRYVPGSVAYHRHHASMRSFGQYREDFLLERNALFTLFKNASDEMLAEALPAAMALAISRGLDKGKVDTEQLDIRRAGGPEVDDLVVAKIALTAPFAIDAFSKASASLRADRDRIQATRIRSDRELWPLFGRVDMPAHDSESYLETYESVVAAFDVVEPMAGKNVLIVTGDPIGRRIAGPAIRVLNIARDLRSRVPVRIVSLTDVEPDFDAGVPAFAVRPGDERGIAVHEEWADIIIVQGHGMAVFEAIKQTRKLLVVDVYDPMQLEQLEQGRSLPRAEWDRAVADAGSTLLEQLERADFLMAASERQRSFWLGQLAAVGRINPATYEDDPHLRDLIDVVPFGLPAEPPVQQGHGLRGTVPGIQEDDTVLVWAGGLYDWFDPLNLIRAIARVAERHPDLRLYFLGTRHPHPGVPEMPIVAESRRLAEELGLTDRHVFFNSDWVEYEDRADFLLDADVGVSTHFAHVETAFSFRTRILDYLWAGLPMVVTRGDHFGDLVEREGLGVAVEPDDVDALAEAIEKVAYDPDFRSEAKAAISRVRDSYRWDAVLAPLRRFIASARPAADRRSPGALVSRPRRRRRKSGLRHDVGLVVFYLRSGGPRTVLAKVRRRLARRRR